MSHLTSGVPVLGEKGAMYSASNEGQTVCGVFSETASLQRSSAHSLGWPYIWSVIFPAENTHLHQVF